MGTRKTTRLQATTRLEGGRKGRGGKTDKGAILNFPLRDHEVYDDLNILRKHRKTAYIPPRRR